MSKHRILFLAANPAGTSQLQLAEECAAIQRELALSATGRDDFQFESRWAVSVDEMMRHLLALEPAIVHFSGHGGRTDGLALQGEDGQPQHVSARALTGMIGSATKNVRVAVLNACYSADQADALRREVDCVVGMTGAIGDAAEHSFAVGFYRALGHRRSIGNAVEQAVATLDAKGFPDHVMPRCVARDGLNASEVFLDPR